MEEADDDADDDGDDDDDGDYDYDCAEIIYDFRYQGELHTAANSDCYCDHNPRLLRMVAVQTETTRSMLTSNALSSLETASTTKKSADGDYSLLSLWPGAAPLHGSIKLVGSQVCSREGPSRMEADRGPKGVNS